jgi:hypothetical protein
MTVADNNKNHYIIKSKSILSVQSKKDQSLTHKEQYICKPHFRILRIVICSGPFRQGANKKFRPEHKIKMEGGENYMKTNLKTSNLV